MYFNEFAAPRDYDKELKELRAELKEAKAAKNPKWVKLVSDKIAEVKKDKERAAKAKQYYLDNKDTINAQQKTYRSDNKDAIAAQQKEYRKNNPDKAPHYDKSYYQANKEAIKAKVKKWQQDNSDKVAAQQKKWREDNPDKVAAYNSIHNAKRKSFKNAIEIAALENNIKYFIKRLTNKKGYKKLVEFLKGILKTAKEQNINIIEVFHSLGYTDKDMNSLMSSIRDNILPNLEEGFQYYQNRGYIMDNQQLIESLQYYQNRGYIMDNQQLIESLQYYIERELTQREKDHNYIASIDDKNNTMERSVGRGAITGAKIGAGAGAILGGFIHGIPGAIGGAIGTGANGALLGAGVGALSHLYHKNRANRLKNKYYGTSDPKVIKSIKDKS